MTRFYSRAEVVHYASRMHGYVRHTYVASRFGDGPVKTRPVDPEGWPEPPAWFEVEAARIEAAAGGESR